MESRGLRPRRFAPCSAPGRRSDRRFRQSPRYTTHAHVTCRRRGADQRHQCHREAGEDAGTVTYSDHGHSLGKVLATAHLRLPFTQIGTVLSIDIDGMPTRAVVSAMPFFDPDGARLKA
jgi:glycine cleavage system aminomethyltransferase T